MVGTSENVIEKLSDKQVNRIDIWRAEVNSARNYCVCSRPTTAAPSGQGARKDAVPPSASSTAIDSDIRPESTPQLVDVSGPSRQPAEPANSSNPRGVPTTSLALKLGCPVCAAPIDEDVSFEVLRRWGESGLVRGRVSPRSSASIHDIRKCVSHQNYKTPATMRFKRAVSKPLQHLKRVTSSGDEKSSEKSKSKGKGKAVLRPLRKLLKGSSKETLSSNAETDEPRIRPRATEMYRDFRPDAGGAGTSAGSVETLLSALSDDERKRPGLTIDESAARLRRAQRLLEKERQK
ncbi:hypothetical protein F5Y06DRAFT_165494 [Hypoxylon sp. FL0890]|nr:hypothetical protein F5Y06DRAFT_165494 [Hypoxylon sp. FL0890]